MEEQPKKTFTVNPMVAARVGKELRTPKKTFSIPYEAMDPTEAERLGMGPGDSAEAELQFTWEPWGDGAWRQWCAEAVSELGEDAKSSHVVHIALSKIIKSSNFGLERGLYIDMQPGVMDWVRETTGLTPKGDEKKAKK